MLQIKPELEKKTSEICVQLKKGSDEGDKGKKKGAQKEKEGKSGFLTTISQMQ